ncbi:uncharacterized protein B0H18DRAFT_1025440, partial [Fomitopsis serialis]|uniref:uncharacterized protein n=1 Tax=Fomitopsis serialis TaxID=139415 RepID=UPI0020086C6D
MPLESGVVTESSFSSAVRSKETRPTVRRRVSDGAARRSRNDHEPHRVAHSRVRTLDGDVTRPTSSHPLASPSSSRAVKDFVAGLLSAHDTRPHMKRVLSDTEAPSNSGNGSSDAIDDQAIEPKTREEEVVVILHEVTSNDSLPGVALKYGVSLPDLRRWNQLWPSDPVHLRKVLYIPLDKARHVKHFHTTLIEVDGGADAPSPASLLAENIVGTANHNVPPLTVVRIPVSQMSFFPPPSTPLSSRSIS